MALAVAAKVSVEVKHFVAGTHALQDQRQVQRGRAAREGHSLLHADLGGELLLEGVDVRPQRGDPVRVERVEQQVRSRGDMCGGDR